jgi:hypothetical protein
MTMATTNGATSSIPARSAGSSVLTRVTHLDELLGAHPGTLRTIYEAGHAAPPSDVVGSWRGRFLALEGGRDVASLMRPLFQVLRGGSPLWQGKTFFADATAINHMLGQKLVRLGVEEAFSELDGAPTLSLRYDLPQHRNPWPIRNVRDELRIVAEGIALGPALFSATSRGRREVLLWFGLQREGA